LLTRDDFAPLDAAIYEELVRRYNQAADAETRLRYQIILLAHQGQMNYQIAPAVLRSRDTVERVIKRFLSGGLEAVPRKKTGSSRPKVSAAWLAELERVVELDPHQVGVNSANWTTKRLADYLYSVSGIATGQESVRTYLHQQGFVCKRPTWTLKKKASEQEGYAGNACGYKPS
jgi:transposase